MVLAIIALAIVPVTGIILSVLKSVLKLSFSVGKILLILLVLWVGFSAVTGGLSEAFNSLGRSKIQHKDNGVINYQMAVGDDTFDLHNYMGNGEQHVPIEIDSILSRVTIKVPEDVIIKIKAQGAIVVIQHGTEREILWAGEKNEVYGSGSKLLELNVRAAFIVLELE